jgi:hypothetical protein
MTMLQLRKFSNFFTSQDMVELGLSVKEPINLSLFPSKVNQKAFGLGRENRNKSLIE